MSRDPGSVVKIFAACLGTVLACVALGAFSGCNIEMLPPFHQNFHLPKMLIGGCIGLLIALGVLLWTRPWSLRLGTGTQLFLRTCYAIAWLAVGCTPFVCAMLPRSLWGSETFYNDVFVVPIIGGMIALFIGGILLCAAIVQWRRNRH